MKLKYLLRLAAGIEYEAVADQALELAPGQAVLVQCERYVDCGTVLRQLGDAPVAEAELLRDAVAHEHGRRLQGQGMPLVRAIASLADVQQREANLRRAEEMRETVLRKVREHHLEMKVISLHCVFDRSLLAIQFSAEGRVDFRELLRDLSRSLHLRVELRQVGVRDETAVFGGLGCCGQPLCCSRFLHDFQSINVKLAKEQGLSLNPANISGICGRLKCCLRYEADGYRDLRNRLPRPGAWVETPDGRGKVIEVLPLKEAVRVSFGPAEAGGGLALHEYAASAVRVLPNP